MDPVSLAIISGILGGAACGVTGESTKGIIDAYKNFRELLMQKYGEKSILLRSICNLEQDPDSEIEQDRLTDDVKRYKANEDPKLLKAAEEVLETTKEHHEGIGIDIETFKAAELELSRVFAVRAGTAIKVKNMTIEGKATISDIGGSSPKL
jgi:hypothetical protein